MKRFTTKEEEKLVSVIDKELDNKIVFSVHYIKKIGWFFKVHFIRAYPDLKTFAKEMLLNLRYQGY